MNLRTFQNDLKNWLGSDLASELTKRANGVAAFLIKSGRIDGDRALANEDGLKGLGVQAIGYALTTEGPWEQGFKEFSSQLVKLYGVDSYAEQRHKMLPLHILAEDILPWAELGEVEEPPLGGSHPEAKLISMSSGRQQLWDPVDIWLLKQPKEDIDILYTHENTGSIEETAMFCEATPKYVRAVVSRARMWGKRNGR